MAETEAGWSERMWAVRREGAGESSVIHVHDRVTGTIAFQVTQDAARALVNELSKVTLMPPKAAVAGPGHVEDVPVSASEPNRPKAGR